MGRDYDLKYQIVYRNRERVGASKGQVVSASEAQTFINVGMLHNQEGIIFTKTPQDVGADNEEEAKPNDTKGQQADRREELPPKNDSARNQADNQKANVLE